MPPPLLLLFLFLPNLSQERGALGEAEQLFRRALVFTEAEYGEHHAETAITIDNLAQVSQRRIHRADVFSVYNSRWE